MNIIITIILFLTGTFFFILSINTLKSEAKSNDLKKCPKCKGKLFTRPKHLDEGVDIIFCEDCNFEEQNSSGCLPFVMIIFSALLIFAGIILLINIIQNYD